MKANAVAIAAALLWSAQAQAVMTACDYFEYESSECAEYSGVYFYEGSETSLMLPVISGDPHNLDDGSIADLNEEFLGLDYIQNLYVSVLPEDEGNVVYWKFDGSGLKQDWDVVKLGVKAAREHYYFYLDKFAGLATDSRDTVIAGSFNWRELMEECCGPYRSVSHLDLFGTPGDGYTVASADEPWTLALLALGLGSAVVVRRRKQ